ncbi:glucan endo-1 3-beta-glucosidase 7 [Prunus yedoensis var. nudiflora]|uniref:glucan endo-1,3-beta-D-glucosidase n=1 Tax=Prunus yedoensis var. nudiflora TaxID=2094558 RepID=A0A314XPH5_PRUYE|nr:glucan endo-1 3-beta-glucosidase 7 [Prunus yedoensis var. nudiflora]
MASLSHLPIFLSLLFTAFYSAASQSFIGVNYGQVADNLPPPAATAKLLQSTAIKRVRLYGADPAIIKALAGTGIAIAIGASNGDIPARLRSERGGSVGELECPRLLPGQQHRPHQRRQRGPLLQRPGPDLAAPPRHAKCPICPLRCVPWRQGPCLHGPRHDLAGPVRPALVGSVQPGLQDVLKGLLAFQRDNGSPFAVNPYPFFAYQSDPRPETLAFCLFQPNAGRVDAGTGIKYMNMFDAQVDGVRSALNAIGFNDIEILIAETGWPYRGDSNEVGPSVENARAYNGNLIAHLRSQVGTPLMPGKSVETYIFALYDEDLKPGGTSERSFGLYKPDLTVTYDVGLSKSSQTPSTTPLTPSTPRVTPSPKPSSAWCVPKAGVSDAQLQANLDYACGHGIDCSAIQPGGACLYPNTVASHAAYAMNLYYHTVGTIPLNCDFSQTATLTSSNPSYNACTYPGGNT